MNYLFLSRWFTYTNEAQTIIMGVLPGPCLILRPYLIVKTAFNGSGTDLIQIGTSVDPDAFGTAQDVSATITDPTLFGAGVGLGYRAAGTKVQATYTRSGTAPTTGEALLILPFIRVPLL